MLHIKYSLYFYIFICNLILVAGCTTISSQEDIDAIGPESTQVSAISATSQTMANENNELAADQYGAELSQTPTIPISSPNAIGERVTEESSTITTPPSMPVLSTEEFPISPTITSTPPSVSTIKDVQCDDSADVFMASQADLEPIHIVRSHILVDDAIMYMGIKQYIRVFDVSNPATPSLLSVWELPAESDISGIRAHNGIGYIASGAALYLVNLASICQPDLFFTVEKPFEISQLEKEEDRLYVGGYERNESGIIVSGLFITVFSVRGPTQPQELTTINLEEPAIWSVNNQKLYFETGSGLYFLNAERPLSETQPINIGLDPEIIAASTPRLIGDRLYLHSWSDGVVIIKHLGSSTPVIEHRRYAYPLSSFFEVHKDYIIVGYGKMCDEPECSSTAYVLSVENGRELSEISFKPYGEVYRYYQIQKDLIYAFSIDSLFIIDLTNLANPTVTKHTLFMP